MEFTIEQQLGAGFSYRWYVDKTPHISRSPIATGRSRARSGPIQQRRRSYSVLPLATEVVLTDPVINQNYQSMQLNLRKRLSAGLEVTALTHGVTRCQECRFYGTRSATRQIRRT